MFQSFRIEYQGFQCQNKIISKVCTLNPRVWVRSMIYFKYHINIYKENFNLIELPYSLCINEIIYESTLK